MVCDVATLLKPSDAFSVMISGVSVGVAVVSVSFSVARSAFTSLSVPLMVRVVPGLDTVFPVPPVSVADSTPLLSCSVTVKISPVVAPLSDTLTPTIESV